MTVDKKQIVKDIQFCKELMDRLVEDVKTYEKANDRIDGNKGYSPDNCRWADWSTQRRNQNRTVAVNQYGTWELNR